MYACMHACVCVIEAQIEVAYAPTRELITVDPKQLVYEALSY